MRGKAKTILLVTQPLLPIAVYKYGIAMYYNAKPQALYGAT
jgi:hypothetical protein